MKIKEILKAIKASQKAWMPSSEETYIRSSGRSASGRCGPEDRLGRLKLLRTQTDGRTKDTGP